MQSMATPRSIPYHTDQLLIIILPKLQIVRATAYKMVNRGYRAPGRKLKE